MVYSTKPHVNSCCCGCSLKVGTLIIAWLYLIHAIVFLVLDYLEISIATGFENLILNNSTSKPNSTVLSENNVIEKPMVNTAVGGIFSSIIDYIAQDFAMYAVQALLSITLIVGASMDKVNMLTLWVWSKAILTGLLTGLSFYNDIYLWYPVTVIELVFAFYFIVVVKSFAIELSTTMNQVPYKPLHPPYVVPPPAYTIYVQQ